MTRTILAISTFAVVLSTAAPATAQTFSWNNSSGGNWNVGSNWAGGTVPAAGQDALIDLAGTYTVSLTDNRSIAAVTVNRDTATLLQTGGDLTASGLFTLQSGTLQLSGGRLLGNGGFTSAAGTTILIDGGQLWANPLSGGPAVINSTVQWSSGEIHGPGTSSTVFSLNGAVNLVGAPATARRIDRTGTIDLNGGGTWDAGRLNLGTSSTILHLASGQTITNTAASGKFILATDGFVGPVFNIDGTFIKQGTNDTEFWGGVTVNNKGLIDVQSGLLNMMGQGTHTGIFQVASGATLQFRGSQTLNSGQLKVLGTGTLVIGDLSGTTTIASAVTVNIASTATVRLNFGSLDLPSNATLAPSLLEISGSVAGSRLSTRGLTAPQTLTMTGGEIRSEADSNVSVAGTFTWGAGEINWVKNFTVTGAANLTGTGTRQLFGDTFNNRTSQMKLNGGGTWDAGVLKMNGLASITIAAGTTITNTTASGDFSILPPDATADGGGFILQGTFIKQGSNTTTFGRDITIANSGHMDIRAGTVVAAEPIFTSGGGDYTLAAGTLLQAPSIDIRGVGANKGILHGVGTVSGSLNVTSGGRIHPGLNGPGVLTVGLSEFSNHFINITGHATDPPRITVDAVRTGTGTADAGRLALVGLNVINFNVGSNGQIVEFEVNGTGLRLGEAYTLIVATSASGFQRNTGTPLLPSGYEFAATDYQLILNSPGAENVRLFMPDANTLAIQFTPVPEPATVLGLGFAGLGLAAFVRRKLYRG